VRLANADAQARFGQDDSGKTVYEQRYVDRPLTEPPSDEQFDRRPDDCRPGGASVELDNRGSHHGCAIRAWLRCWIGVDIAGVVHQHDLCRVALAPVRRLEDLLEYRNRLGHRAQRLPRSLILERAGRDAESRSSRFDGTPCEPLYVIA
jgi:hypothetical protein